VVVELLAAVDVAARVIDPTSTRRSLEPAVIRLVRLDADDRRDALGPARLVEVEDAVHVAVIGDPDRGLPVRDGGGDHLLDPCRTVEHGELGMQM
jgi:hypothetical protein